MDIRGVRGAVFFQIVFKSVSVVVTGTWILMVVWIFLSLLRIKTSTFWGHEMAESDIRNPFGGGILIAIDHVDFFSG